MTERTIGDNRPPVRLELTHEEAAFLRENCEGNIVYGLNALDRLSSRDLLEKMVHNIEMFKAIMNKIPA